MKSASFILAFLPIQGKGLIDGKAQLLDGFGIGRLLCYSFSKSALSPAYEYSVFDD